MVNNINYEGQLALRTFIQHYLLGVISNEATELPFVKELGKPHIFILQKNLHRGNSLKMSVKI